MGSVTLNMTGGQGITQTIAQKLNLSADDLKKINQNKSVWNNVLNEVKKGQTSDSASKTTVDGYNSSDFDKKGSWAFSDGNSVTISEESWSNISTLLNIAKGDLKDVKNLAGEIKTTPEPKLNTEIKPINVEVPEYATGKQITRSVNGKPQKIEIAELNGQKVRFAVNDDGTRGESLVTVTTTGKNTYQTQSEFDKTVRSTLGLKDGQNLPDNLKPYYVEIGGYPQLMFKSDNGTLTPKQAAEYCKQHIAQGAREYEGKSIKDITTDIAKKIDYSKLSPGALDSQPVGVQLNFGGKMYTVQNDNGAKVFVDDQGNKFKAENGKLLPIKTATTNSEPVQTYIKSGSLNFDSSASDDNAPWIKGGRLDD